MIDLRVLTALLPEHLPAQRWYSGDKEPDAVRIQEIETIRSGDPGLVWLLVDVDTAAGPATYQLYLGVREPAAEPEFFRGKEAQILTHGGDGEHAVYDAVMDLELAVAILEFVAPDTTAERARTLAVEQSNTSIVFDEKAILKIFRRVHHGPNPDVEMSIALDAAGYEHVAPTIATHQREGTDLAVLRTYLLGAVDGWQLALTSLRDVFGSRLEPGQSGGDFAPEAHRLGEITAGLHLALASEFGSADATPDVWADDLRAHLQRVDGSFDKTAVGHVYEQLASTRDAGASIRIHGDFHLGQTLRADTGWYILDFEGEPDRPLEERRRPSSPLRDVAGMQRSFHYAAEIALRERRVEVDDELARLARLWEERASHAFLDGYAGTPGIEDLLPSEPAVVDLVRNAFELDKAVYEIGYERGYRPDWVSIPESAVERILMAGSGS